MHQLHFTYFKFLIGKPIYASECMNFTSPIKFLIGKPSMQVNASTSIHSDWQTIICNYFMSQVFSFFNNNKEMVKEEKIYKTSKLSSKISSYYFLFPKKKGSYYKSKSKSGETQIEVLINWFYSI